MQYQFVGTDPQGRLLYEPIPQQITMVQSEPQINYTQPFMSYTQISELQPVKTSNKKSILSPWFVIQDGTISISLKNLTIIIGLAISATLLYMLYQSCTAGTFECTVHDFPMVSTVIAQEMYNRTFILLTAIFMFGVQQANLRAFYKRMYGVISNCYNDFLLCLGLISTVSLPMIGIFDEHQWSKPHGFFAVVFFGCFGTYQFLLGRAFYFNKDKFPQTEQSSIHCMYINTYGLILGLVALGISMAIYSSNCPTPFFEWFVVLYFVNFFAIASFENPFYNTVHQEGTLVAKKQI